MTRMLLPLLPLLPTPQSQPTLLNQHTSPPPLSIARSQHTLLIRDTPLPLPLLLPTHLNQLTLLPLLPILPSQLTLPLLLLLLPTLLNQHMLLLLLSTLLNQHMLLQLQLILLLLPTALLLLATALLLLLMVFRHPATELLRNQSPLMALLSSRSRNTRV